MKVLIVSHNPITTYQSMGKTMLSLFSAFQKEELCQLYVYPSVPDVDACNSWFRITDRNVLKSYLRLGKIESRRIGAEQIDTTAHQLFESKDDEKLLKKKKTYGRILTRDLLWKCANWYDGKLKAWLAEEKPDRIFLAPGESKFIYDVALKIQRELNIPICTYVCDEFYFVEPPKSPVGIFQLRRLQKKIRALMRKTSHLITICDELSEAYGEEFHLPATTILTGTNYPIAEKPCIREQIAGITYLGNLAFGRLESILNVAAALRSINETHGTEYKLFLYTRSLTEEQTTLVNQTPEIKYCGFVTGEDFNKTLHGADMLLHIESFTKESIDRVKHSVSTKIADSLGAGIPLLAYAPNSIASVTHLQKHCAAFVATDKEKLLQVLTEALTVEARRKMSQFQLEAAKTYHSSEVNSQKLHKVLMQLH